MEIYAGFGATVNVNKHESTKSWRSGLLTTWRIKRVASAVIYYAISYLTFELPIVNTKLFIPKPVKMTGL